MNAALSKSWTYPEFMRVGWKATLISWLQTVGVLPEISEVGSDMEHVICVALEETVP